MLNGIGGRTIEEAKRSLSYTEAVSWIAYVRQTGTLNFGTRLEQGFALLATVLNRAHGGKAEFSDFLPNREPAVEIAEATPQDILSLLRAVKR